MQTDRVSPFWKRMAKVRRSEPYKAYHAHIFGCLNCRPQVGRYCDEGFRHWAAYQVPLRAASIMEEPSLRRRRAMMEVAPGPLRDLIAQEVKRLWDAKQQERRDAR